MQDITPHNRSPQNRRPAGPLGARDRSSERRVPPRSVYTRQTRVFSDIASPVRVVEVEESFTTYTPEPLPMTRPIESLSSSAKAQALERALVNARRSLKAEQRKRRDLKKFGIIFVASLLVLVTGYVSVDTWITNSRVKAEGAGAEQSAGTWSKDDEGKDETQPSANTLANYSVAPALPRALYIDKLDVAARILPMSVNTDGSVQSPRNVFDAGWYNGSVKPGEIGAMFIDGHASGPTREGLFAYLDDLVEGDHMQIEKGDGTRLTYKVVHLETVKLEDVDMKKMLLPYGNALRGLNLMTCTGKWVEDQKTYDHRVLVWAEQV